MYFIECYASSIALVYNSTSDQTEVYNNTDLVESYYSITCCRNGYPIPDPSIAPRIQSWSQQLAGPVHSNSNATCNRYIGQYSLPFGWTTNNKDVTVGVRCQCPEDNLDRNCRYLPDCANSGYRSFSINLRCVCPPQYFGELCEKYCLNGDLVKDSYQIDQCVCPKYFYGDECEHITCFNGGTAVNGRGCSCQIPYVGLHCETRINGTIDDSLQYHHDSLQKDLSGTIVSLFLVIAVGLIIFYLIRRHRRMRRAAAQRTITLDPVGNPGGPYPSYANAAMVQNSFPSTPNSQPLSIYNMSQFPPLPAYNDVVKSSPPVYIYREPVETSDMSMTAPIENVETSVENNTNSNETPFPIDSMQQRI